MLRLSYPWLASLIRLLDRLLFWLSRRAVFLAAPPGWGWIVVGFVLFRFFDIVKPWPIGWLDRQVKGGMGIMVDDVVAGVYALLCLQLLALFW